jgi:hypothetical protein
VCDGIELDVVEVVSVVDGVNTVAAVCVVDGVCVANIFEFDFVLGWIEFDDTDAESCGSVVGDGVDSLVAEREEDRKTEGDVDLHFNESGEETE